ncbi:hypothetical protein J3R83DRAFT_259 [Lanmaoa asiatica]|nr:hypothetical protein J3R83DRAFT_259 [Lanmaoa asiatica]
MCFLISFRFPSKHQHQHPWHPNITAEPWKQDLQDGINLLLLLQYSFTLVQNNSEDPFSLTIQKYEASGISAQISKILDELFVKYSIARDKEREKLVMDVILHHCLCR